VIQERFATTAAAVPAVLRASDADAASTASVSEGAQAASLYSSFSSETSVSVYESRLRGVCDRGTSTRARPPLTRHAGPRTPLP
jgi:hypothetical protein